LLPSVAQYNHASLYACAVSSQLQGREPPAAATGSADNEAPPTKVIAAAAKRNTDDFDLIRASLME
jgi:hypothetical protein